MSTPPHDLTPDRLADLLAVAALSAPTEHPNVARLAPFDDAALRNELMRRAVERIGARPFLDVLVSGLQLARSHPTPMALDPLPLVRVTEAGAWAEVWVWVAADPAETPPPTLEPPPSGPPPLTLVRTD